MEKIIKWFSVFLLSLLILLGLILFSSPPADVSGTLHPEHVTMLKSGTSVANLSAGKWLAYLYGLGVLGLFAFPMFMGAYKADPRKNRAFQKVFFIGMGMYAIVFTCMVISYWQYNQGQSDQFFLGFPAPTAWMLFGLGSVPLIFTVFYIRNFERWVISPEEMEQFQKIVKARREREAS